MPTEQIYLQKLLDQYRLPKSLYCKAITVTDYKTIPPGLFHVEGTQEFWVAGSKYRILQLRNSMMYPGMSHDVRWDGEQFQWLDVGDGTLLFSSRSNQKTPYIAEPLPLLPLAFLNPAGDRLGQKLSLHELLGARIRRELANANVVGSGGSLCDFPGGRMGDVGFKYRIAFEGSPAYLPTIISRVSSAGIELERDEIRYQPVQCAAGIFYLPKRARLTDRTTDGRIDVISTWTATSIEADISIAPETFTMDFQMAKHVLNIDAIGLPKVSRTSPVAASVPSTMVVPNIRIVGDDNTAWPIGILALLLSGLAMLLIGAAVLYYVRFAKRE